MKSIKVGIAGLVLLSTTAANAGLIGPTPYLQATDSPFSGIAGFSYFHLEDFEDGFNTPGVSGSGASLCVTALDCFVSGGISDSVDADNGVVDGSGLFAKSHWASGAIEYTFNAAVLGALPTHVGVVWTDGSNTVRFEAWDQSNNSLGFLTGNHVGVGNGAGFFGGTDEDRFYGVDTSGFVGVTGISRIRIENFAPIETDHLQYGCLGATCPGGPGPGQVSLPATLALLSIGLAGIGYRTRRQIKVALA